MKLHLGAAALCFGLLLTEGYGQGVAVEPDQYPNGTVLNQIVPAVSLVTARNDNQAIPFDVRATTSTFPFLPPTGTNVFAHAGGIPFWYTDRRLRMDFAGLISTLSIDFQGGNALVQELGTLEVYNAQNVLLTSYTTAPLLGGQIEAMSINRAFADIAYAVAYTLPGGESNFGRLDHLVFSTPVPEPSAFWLLGAGLVAALALRRQNHGRR